MTRIIAAALLAGTALAAAPAHAQAQPDLAAEVAALRAEVEALRARVAQAEAAQGAAPVTIQAPAAPAESAQVKADAPEASIRFSGAPRITAPGGWSFKPRGRLQYDAGWVESPAGVTDRGLGFANEVRRARLGVQGAVPGGFEYKFEVDFADGEIAIADALIGYEASDNVGIVIGQHNNFQSMEELTSSLFTSFMERAAFTDAFGFERRVGISAGYQKGPLLAQAGIFTDAIDDLSDDENDSVGVDARLVFAPEVGGTQLHFGGSAHFRDNNDLAARGDTTRYRQRPFLHSTDTRFLATPALPVEQETSYGLEAAAIRGPFHAAAELHWLDPDIANPAFDPTFFGGYAEVGWFLTGETRGYKNGAFDRTRVRHSVEEGGWGALQLNLRYDHLDLTDGGVVGGSQNAILASLIWIPTDYVRFLLNYGRLNYDNAAIPAAGGDRDYAVDVVGARAQIDF